MDITLTDSQKALFPSYLDKWLKIGFTTGKTDRMSAEEGVRNAYEIAGFKPPQRILWLGSPFAGALFDTAVQASANKKSPKPISTPIPPAAKPILEAVMEALFSVPGLSAYSIDDLWSLAHALNLSNVSYGQHDAAILCFYDFFAEVCGIEECKKLSGLNQIANSSGWWWAYDSLAVMTDRPLKLTLDERGNFHAEKTWALLYPDGFGICSVRGVTVPPWIILEPSSITVAHIDAEPNVEIRRVMLDKFGWGRYILESGAVAIDSDDWGTLYRKEVPEDEPLVMVKVVNSTPEPDGHYKDYLIRVPPTMTSAHEAVAWHTGLEKDEYAPNVET